LLSGAEPFRSKSGGHRRLPPLRRSAITGPPKLGGPRRGVRALRFGARAGRPRAPSKGGRLEPRWRHPPGLGAGRRIRPCRQRRSPPALPLYPCRSARNPLSAEGLGEGSEVVIMHVDNGVSAARWPKGQRWRRRRLGLQRRSVSFFRPGRARDVLAQVPGGAMCCWSAGSFDDDRRPSRSGAADTVGVQLDWSPRGSVSLPARHR